MFRSAYSKKERILSEVGARSRTRQSMKDECDVNRIVAKFKKTGLVNHFAKYGGQYMDCPAVDFREALEMVATAETMFKELPSDARKRFDNDPARFLEFVQNPANLPEMRKLGLAKPEAEPVKPPA